MTKLIKLRSLFFIVNATIVLFFIHGCRTSYSHSGWNTKQIQIARDTFGVPHIFGKKDADVAYGLAWAHSEDNFATIQKIVLAGKSMAGRVFGSDGAAADFLVKLLQTQKIAASKYDSSFSPEFKRVLEGYAAGLNDYALTHPRDVLLKDAFPVNTIDITSAYILSLAQMAGADLAVKQIVDNKIKLTNSETKENGSNSFAIHSSRTNTNECFLVSNSHQPLEGVEAWYEAHLHSEEGWNIIGSLYPGAAMVFHGTNENLGWAHTVNSPDLLDIFQLTLNPDNNNQYLVDGRWLELERRTIWLQVKVLGLFSIPIHQVVYKSIYGPTLLTKQGAFAVKTGVLDNIGAAEQWWRMNKAKNFSEFKHAMTKMQIPCFNVLYADKFDTIFYASNALLPVRDSNFNYTGIVQGNTFKTVWKQYYKFSDLPQQINPKSGYLYNTNHSPFRASSYSDNLDSALYPAQMNFTLVENNRSMRFRELMSDTGMINYEQFKKIKYDNQLPSKLMYRTIMDAVFSLDSFQYPDIAKQIEAIKKWDKKAGIDSKGAAIFAFQYHFWRETFTRTNRSINYTLSEKEAAKGLREAKKHFLKYFGKEIVTLGEYHKLVRGNKSLPIWGIDDVLTTMKTKSWQNGMRKAAHGDSYIMFSRFGKGLPKIETINVFGASNTPNQPHYDDQMTLFQQQKLKPMTLDKLEVLKTAKKIYHPELQEKN